MANQQQIDASSQLIASIVSRAREELINDLYLIGVDVDDIPAFVDAILALDVNGTLRNKLQNATSIYTDAHRDVLESTISFAEINPNSLTSFINLNQQVFDNAITSNISSHLKNELIKGLQAGLSIDDIVLNVAQSSISDAQIETLINTTLNSYSRTVTNSMMKAAPDNTKYWYVGPFDEKTRDICAMQITAGRLTQAEIIANFGAGVLIEGGGFNCRHKWEIAAEESDPFYRGDAIKALEKA